MNKQCFTLNVRSFAFLLVFLLIGFLSIDCFKSSKKLDPREDFFGVSGCRSQPSPKQSTLRNDAITFIAFGDPQVGGPSPNMNFFQIRAINKIANNYSWQRSGAKITGIRGVIIAGDLTEHAYIGEFKKFASYYGICGNKLLRYPVYEGYGNHDFARSYKQPILDYISVRNRYRVGVKHVAPGTDGHYSWDWGSVHFVHLNLAPTDREYIKVRGKKGVPFTARRALTFLKKDLKKYVPNRMKRVVIISHYGFIAGWDIPRWWSQKDAERFYSIIQGYNIIAFIHGHDHGTGFYKWRGINVFNVGSPFYTKFNADRRGHFTVFKIGQNYIHAQDVSWHPKQSANVKRWRSRFFIKKRIK